MTAVTQCLCDRPRLRCAGLAAVVLLLSACAAHVTGLQVAPDFDYESAVAKGFVVGGVVSSLNDNTEDDYPMLLQEAFAEEQPNYPVDGTDDVVSAIGADTHRQLLAEYQQTGDLSEESLALLTGSLVGSRYILFVHLERDETSQSRYSIDRVGHFINGRYYLTRTTTTRTTSRAVTALATVFDSRDGSPVWRGTVGPRVSNISNRTTHRLFYSIDRDWYYPDPPSLRRAINAALIGIVENLPKPG